MFRIVLAFIFISRVAIHAQNWATARLFPSDQATTAPAISADGSLMFWPIQGALVYSSTNFGVSWQTNSVPTATNISSIICSSDGRKLAAAADNGIYISGDAGQTWQKTSVTLPQPRTLSTVTLAASADASKIIAIPFNLPSLPMLRSEDFGSAWAPIHSADFSWQSAASSGDGTILVAVGGSAHSGERAIISTNSGAAWMTNEVLINADRIAISADGQTILAAGPTPQIGPLRIYVSTNSAFTWKTNTFGEPTDSTFPGFTSISADGRAMVVGTPGMLVRSDDAGQNWTFEPTPVSFGAVSGDGKIMVAASLNPATLRVRSSGRPIIYRTPANLTVVARTNMNFTVTATGAPTLGYQWFFENQSISTAHPLAFSPTNSGTISVTVQNTFGADTATHTTLNVLPIGVRMNNGAVSGIWPFVAQVASGNAQTTTWFEWGADTNYGNMTAPTNVPAAVVRNVYAFPPALDLGVYHVRAISSNSFGQAVSADARFVPYPVTAGMDVGTNINNVAAGLSFFWHERGFNLTNRGAGLPAPGSVIASQSDPLTTFRFATNYGKPNAILVDQNNRGAFTFATPASYSRLTFLTSSGGGAVTIRYILTHSDNSTETGTFISDDWFFGANPAFTANSRVVGVSPLAFPNTQWTFNTEAADPRLYGKFINVTNPLPITSIELAWQSGSGHSAVFAVSGSNDTIFTPIEVMGFTHDMIVEAEYSGEPHLISGNAQSRQGAFLQVLPGVAYEIFSATAIDSTNWPLATNLSASTRTTIPIAEIDSSEARFFRARAK